MAKRITGLTGVMDTSDVYLAQDSDFVNVNDCWVYRGAELEVEIPTHIEGQLVTSTQYMFRGDSPYQATPVTKVVLKHSNVTNIHSMFRDSSATTLDLSSFNTSNVTDMRFMFGDSSATTLDLSSFNTSNVTRMNYMFDGSKATTGYARTQADADKFNASSGKPSTLTFVVKPYSDTPTSLTPNQELLNPRQEIGFKWNTKERQKEFELRWRVVGGSWTTKTVVSTQTVYKMPPGTITANSGEVAWQVRALPDLREWQELAEWSAWSEIATFELGTPDQPPAIMIGPDGDYIRSNQDLVFEWAFIPNSIEMQSAYELEYYIGSTRYTLTGGTERRAVVDISKASSSTGRWRVKVKNNFNQWAEWSEEGTFTIVALPNAPVIENVTDESYPLVTWRSREQGAYKLSIDSLYGYQVYDSGSILSDSDRAYRVPVYLKPGRYVAKLSINNKYGLLSETSEYSFDVIEADIDTPTIDLINTGYYIDIRSDSLDGKVLRDGKIIGDLKDGRFIDATGVNNKTYDYQVMALEGYKTKASEAVQGQASFKGNTIAGTENPSDFFILKWNVSEKPKRAKSFDYESAEFKIDGKKYPVTEYGAYQNEILSLVFTVKNEEIDRLTEILSQKEDLIYRDYEGFNMIGVISPIALDPVGDTRTKQVTFSITKTRDDYE